MLDPQIRFAIEFPEVIKEFSAETSEVVHTLAYCDCCRTFKSAWQASFRNSEFSSPDPMLDFSRKKLFFDFQVPFSS